MFIYRVSPGVVILAENGKQTKPVQTVTSGNLWTAVIFLRGLPDPRKTMGNVSS